MQVRMQVRLVRWLSYLVHGRCGQVMNVELVLHAEQIDSRPDRRERVLRVLAHVVGQYLHIELGSPAAAVRGAGHVRGGVGARGVVDTLRETGFETCAHQEAAEQR